MAGFLQNILGGGSSSDDNKDENNNNNSNNQNNDNNDPNNKDNIDKPTNIWETPKTDENNQQNNNQNNQNQNNQNNQIAPEDALKNHIDGLDLTNGVDASKIQEDLQAGNTDSFTSALETVAANAYKASLTQMNTIMDSKIAAATEKATQDAKSSMDADIAVREMDSQLKFTADPNIAPIAKAVLNQFLKAGKDLPAAIKETADFFKSTNEKMNSVSTPPNNDLSNNNFNQQNNSNNNNEKSSQETHDEFLDLLGAG